MKRIINKLINRIKDYYDKKKYGLDFSVEKMGSRSDKY